jgi:hypothetical protein
MIFIYSKTKLWEYISKFPDEVPHEAERGFESSSPCATGWGKTSSPSAALWRAWVGEAAAEEREMAGDAEGIQGAVGSGRCFQTLVPLLFPSPVFFFTKYI